MTATSVPARSLHRAVALAVDVLDLADPAALADVVMRGVHDLIGCDFVTLNRLGPASGEVQFEQFPQTLSALDGQLFAHYSAEHPLVAHYRRTGDTEARSFDDVISRAELSKLGLYQDFFRKVRVHDQLAVTIAPPGALVVGIALNRGTGRFSASDQVLLTALRAALSIAVARAVGRDEARAAIASGPQALATLTEREIELLSHVASGATNVAIARRLRISPRTVAKHLEHVYRKLGVANRAAAVSSTGASQLTGRPSSEGRPPRSQPSSSSPDRVPNRSSL